MYAKILRRSAQKNKYAPIRNVYCHSHDPKGDDPLIPIDNECEVPNGNCANVSPLAIVHFSCLDTASAATGR